MYLKLFIDLTISALIGFTAAKANNFISLIFLIILEAYLFIVPVFTIPGNEKVGMEFFSETFIYIFLLVVAIAIGMAIGVYLPNLSSMDSTPEESSTDPTAPVPTNTTPTDLSSNN